MRVCKFAIYHEHNKLCRVIQNHFLARSNDFLVVRQCPMMTNPTSSNNVFKSLGTEHQATSAFQWKQVACSLKMFSDTGDGCFSTNGSDASTSHIGM